MDQPKYSLTPVEGNPWADMGETDIAGVTDPADPTGGAALTIAPEDHLSEHDKVLAHLAWLKAQSGSPDETSALMYSLDPRHSDDEALSNLRMAQIRSGKWTGVGRHTGGLTDAADVGARMVAHVLGTPQDAVALGRDSADEMARTGHAATPDIAGRSLGLSLGLAAGGMSLAEPGAAGIFGGRLSQTADHYDLGAAKMKAALGADSASVWSQHGWYKDVDGNWKYEIPDAGAKLAAVNTDLPEGSTYRMGDVLDHPELYSAYPSLADMRVGFDARGNLKGSMDLAHPHGPTVQLNPAMSPDEQLSVALHEIQHNVQETEGFARGAAVRQMSPENEAQARELAAEHAALMQKGIAQGNTLHPDELARYNSLGEYLGQVRDWRSAAYKDYSNSAGEVEARNVQSRFGVTPEESRALHPDATADVEPGDRRVSFQVEGGPASQSIVPEFGAKGKAYLEEQQDKVYNGPDSFYETHKNLGLHLGEHAEGTASDSTHGYAPLSPETKSLLDYHMDVASALDAGQDPTRLQVPFGIEGYKTSSTGWSPEALEYLNNEKDWFKGKTTVGAQNSLKIMDNIIAGGPEHELPISDPFHGMLMDAKKIHNDPLTPNTAAVPQTTLKTNGWNPQAESHLMTAAGDAHLAGNTGLSVAIDDMTKAGPGSAPDPTKPNYWKLLDLHDKATELHSGTPAAPVELPSLTGDTSHIAQALRPIDWTNYQPNKSNDWKRSAALPQTMAEKAEAARALGFNPDVPLFKGMTYHSGEPGQGLGELGGFADPANKPHERAIFATHEPEIANLYNYGEDKGYSMLPMYGRANNAHEVNWPDIAPNSYYSERPMQQLIEHARANNIDALVIHNIEDSGGPQTQYAFMHPELFRSHIAQFDPAKLSSPDLLHTKGLGVRFDTDADQQARKKRSIVLHLGDNQ